MGNSVALTTRAEFLEHAGWVWGFMAFSAVRYCFVDSFMASNTGNGSMLGLAGAKQTIDFVMAGATVFRRGVGGIGYL